MEIQISVIVPVYNVEKYLPYCLQSLERQIYKGFELILVDDGSPDQCGKICDDYAKSHANTIVIHQENQGLSVARNNGVKRSIGEYITFIDSDDLVSDDYLSTLYELIIKYEADISVGKLCAFWGEATASYKPNKNKPYIIYEYETEKALEEMMYGLKYGVQGCNKLFRRQLVEMVHFPVGKLHEDQGTMYKIVNQSRKLVYINKPIYFYRQREDSIVHTKLTEAHLYGLEAVKEQLAFIQEKFPNIVSAAEFRVAIVVFKWIPGILSGTPEDKKAFQYLRSEVLPYCKSIIHNKRVSKTMKVRTIAIRLGYFPSQWAFRILDVLRKSKSKAYINS